MKDYDMELKPSHEMFAHELIAKKGNATKAYAAVYPKANEGSARHGGSFLLRNVDIRVRVSQLLEANGLGVADVVKILKRLTGATKLVPNGMVCHSAFDNKVNLEAVKILLRLYGLCGNEPPAEISLTSEQVDRLAQILREQLDPKT